MSRARTRSLVRLLLLALCFSFGPLASRGLAEAPPSPEADSAAREAFESGREAYELGNFREALAHFERAQALSPRPVLLYNVGRAADEDGQSARAIEAYTSYLEAVPEADNRDFVRARLEKMHALEELHRSAQPEPPSVPSASDAAATETAAADSDEGAGTIVLGPAPTTKNDAPAARPFYKRAWFWGTVGGVIATGVIASVIATREDAPQRAPADVYIFTPRAQW